MAEKETVENGLKTLFENEDTQLYLRTLRGQENLQVMNILQKRLDALDKQKEEKEKE